MKAFIVQNWQTEENVTSTCQFFTAIKCSQSVHSIVHDNEKFSKRTFVLKGDPSAKYIPDEAEIVYGDLCNPDSLEEFFKVPEGTETIAIHVASMVTVNPDFNQKLIDVNVGGTKNMIKKCLEHPECKKMVYVSSTGAIPELPKGQKIKEVNQFNPEKVVGWYSKTKAKKELGYHTRSYAETLHDEAVWLRQEGKIA